MVSTAKIEKITNSIHIGCSRPKAIMPESTKAAKPKNNRKKPVGINSSVKLKIIPIRNQIYQAINCPNEIKKSKIK